MTAPVLFAFGLHLHQPVGNFDSVLEEHLDQVYRPLLDALETGGILPVTLHLSGPLLDWLEARGPDYLDRIGALAGTGRIELLLSGYDEPILAVLPREDRLEQITRMAVALRHRFGAQATGLWLTERVWEPDLPEELARAGVRYVLVDDRHFLINGYDRGALHQPYRTESGGHSVTCFPIDERLRYLVPFRPPAELAEYFRTLRRAGAPLAVLADDAEKFGGWPGTREWVYERGWMAEFAETLRELVTAGEIRLVTFAEALAEVPSAGLAYLPSASYREMEGWALAAPAALRLTGLERELGEERLAGPDGALIRGTHWRNFLARYPESNRMHKKMLVLSALCRGRADPPAARRAIGRAQCNDAYWHGVFGGLYLPHLRHAVWAELARAEALLRRGEPLRFEWIDLDRDGHEEIWVHSEQFSALVSPARGGAVEEWTVFALSANLAASLTRRREAYHESRPRNGDGEEPPADDVGAPSIHHLEKSLALSELPPFDRYDRALFQEHLLAGMPDATGLNRGQLPVLRSWIGDPGSATVRVEGGTVEIDIRLAGLDKRISFTPGGNLSVTLEWEEPGDPERWLVTELSVSGPIQVDTDAEGQWRYPIETVAKSERGFDRTLQGTAVVLGWPAHRRRGRVSVQPGAPDPEENDHTAPA